MKKSFILSVVLALMLGTAHAAMTGLDGHKSYIYPVVRVTTGNGGGSGTIIYSKEFEPSKFSTYILTNHHIIADAITITE